MNERSIHPQAEVSDACPAREAKPCMQQRRVNVPIYKSDEVPAAINLYRMPTIVEPKPAPTLQQPTEQFTTLHNHVFRVHLPDFRAEDIRVEVEKTSRKITVRNRGIVVRVDVPDDADIDLIGARFEQSWLSLLMPKKMTAKDKKSADAPTVRGNASQKDDSLREGATEEREKKARCEDKKEAAPMSCGTKEKPTGEGKNDERSQDAREKTSQKATPTTDKARTRRKSDGSGKTPCASWRSPIDEVEEWFDQSETLHKLMESFNKNRSVIAAAAVGFSVGFFVAQKLRSSSR